jgi:hypothetical protein
VRCFKDSGSLKVFGRKAWRFQQTFQTPLKQLGPFVGEIVWALGEVTSGRVTIEQVVFEPTNLIALTKGAGCEGEVEEGWSVEANGPSEVEALLKAALGDWVDFIFVPVPARFVIYADHDEYVTLVSMTKRGLGRVVNQLTAKGFSRVEYQRRL